ncbi:hypothetical protein B0H17DRAFT_1210370 [Mycena rosella]|uniref:Uncharacterized protein n=1 Tax=Mycena rosella TaxID=1033263 RepID=A0AAD7G4M1_MYCRO|nr:hypothetical protein B0H17DRAFT_1210370 [Mycena rosella]
MADGAGNDGAAANNRNGGVSSFKMPEPWDRNKPTFDSDDHEELLTFVDHVSQIFTKANITDEAQKKEKFTHFLPYRKKKYWRSLAIYGTGTYVEFLEEVFKSYPEVKMEEISWWKV